MSEPTEPQGKLLRPESTTADTETIVTPSSPQNTLAPWAVEIRSTGVPILKFGKDRWYFNPDSIAALKSLARLLNSTTADSEERARKLSERCLLLTLELDSQKSLAPCPQEEWTVAVIGGGMMATFYELTAGKRPLLRLPMTRTLSKDLLQGIANAHNASLAPCPKTLTGEWRYAGGYLCCGTLRIARVDFDTDPSPEFQAQVFDQIVTAMNASSVAPCPIKDEGEETRELGLPEAKADNVNAVLRNDRESPFQDSPLLAAKRRAFDNPTLANLDLLIDEAIKATHRLTRQSIAEHLAKACQWLDEFVEMPEMFPSDRDVQWWEERRQGIRDLARQALPSEHGGG